jgi:hypothetical protein
LRELEKATRLAAPKDAVFTLVGQHLRLAERKKRKLQLGEETAR